MAAVWNPRTLFWPERAGRLWKSLLEEILNVRSEVPFPGSTHKTLPGLNILGSSSDSATFGKIQQYSMKRHIYLQTARPCSQDVLFRSELWAAPPSRQVAGELFRGWISSLPYTKSRHTRRSSVEIVNGQINYV
eukprot:9070501-Pyramimonas_sp.AAC.1